mmetsp:Transcript_83847/g.211462  ORF Transcript_83847/g.211462 Transcript_83847/m.211462 type:complete len:148 (+) Transcript_83847:72-515(+)
MTGRRSAVLLPLLVASAGAYLLLSRAWVFVAPPRTALRGGVVTLRAEETATETKAETDSFSMPKPDMNILNRNAKVGQTYDQDRRGNMWSVDNPVRTSEEDELIPTPVFFVFFVVANIAWIIFAAQLTGNDSRFGGVIGDGSLTIGD